MNKLSYWCKRFQTTTPKVKKISKGSVTLPKRYKKPPLFRGWCAEEDCLLYQKQFTDEFIVHELLHREFPNLTESEVRKLTKIIIY